MKTCLLGLLAETSIHPGASQSSGIVDLPVAREAATITAEAASAGEAAAGASRRGRMEAAAVEPAAATAAAVRSGQSRRGGRQGERGDRRGCAKFRKQFHLGPPSRFLSWRRMASPALQRLCRLHIVIDMNLG